MKDPPSDLNSTFAEDSTVSPLLNLTNQEEAEQLELEPLINPFQSAIEENTGGRKDSELESYRLRLKEELISRDGYKYVDLGN